MARILVAEDEAMLRMLMVDDLADDGHDVIEAPTGDAAAALLATQPTLDLLVTDIRMPGKIDGWQLGQLAAQTFPGIRVIYATGFCEDARELGPHERLLNKPFLYAQVRQAIAELGVVGE